MKLDSIHVTVVGLGYVGLPLAIEFGKKYPTTGFDTDAKRVNELQDGIDRNNVVSKSDIVEANFLQLSNELTSNTNNSLTQIYIITVPTPINTAKAPDLGYLFSATKSVGEVLRKADIGYAPLVIFESSVYPGCTEEKCVPVLEKESGLTYNVDFFCGYSPERINPGDTENTLTKIKKITAGSTPQVADFVDSLYNSILENGTYKAPSIRVAEAAKLVENTQRYVNITLMNEFAMLFDSLNMDVEEVLDAAKTKWNFHAYYPGVIGGPCLEASTVYLRYKAVQENYTPKLLLASEEVNQDLHSFVASKLQQQASELTKISKKKAKRPLKIAGIDIAPAKPSCNFVTNQYVKDIWEEIEVV
jgi:UDP-N-acetyl-D-glucosamine/UDP-N-acetyl-D-galactosamine dehydrogenase